MVLALQTAYKDGLHSCKILREKPEHIYIYFFLTYRGTHNVEWIHDIQLYKMLKGM